MKCFIFFTQCLKCSFDTILIQSSHVSNTQKSQVASGYRLDSTGVDSCQGHCRLNLGFWGNSPAVLMWLLAPALSLQYRGLPVVMLLVAHSRQKEARPSLQLVQPGASLRAALCPLQPCRLPALGDPHPAWGLPGCGKLMSTASCQQPGSPKRGSKRAILVPLLWAHLHSGASGRSTCHKSWARPRPAPRSGRRPLLGQEEELQAVSLGPFSPPSCPETHT